MTFSRLTCTLIINKHTHYCWCTTYSKWEIDLSMKTWSLKSQCTMQSRSMTNVMWLVNNLISRTISTLTNPSIKLSEIYSFHKNKRHRCRRCHQKVTPMSCFHDFIEGETTKLFTVVSPYLTSGNTPLKNAMTCLINNYSIYLTIDKLICLLLWVNFTFLFIA